MIDAKRYKGRPELKIERGMLRPRVEKVLVGRRDCTNLVDGVLKQVKLVRDVVGDLPVTGALCFVDGDCSLIGGAFTTRAVHVLWPKRLAKLLTNDAQGAIDVTPVGEPPLRTSRNRSSLSAKSRQQLAALPPVRLRHDFVTEELDPVRFFRIILSKVLDNTPRGLPPRGQRTSR